MNARAAVTIDRSRDEVQQLWEGPEHRPGYIAESGATVSFEDAPGDRGTEIHVEVEKDIPAGRLGEAVQKVVGTEPLAKVKDELRRFKQRVETGEVPRSDGTPDGERLERKFKQRPAQPLDESELEKAGAR